MYALIDKIIELLREGMSGDGALQIKQFYFGDPIDIPESCLPCIAVEPDRTEVEHGPTGMDDVGYNIVVKVIMDKREDWGKEDSGDVAGVRKLIELTEGQTQATDLGTVVGILRTNFTLGENVHNQELTIEYGVTPRPKEVLTAEASVMVNINDLIQVDNRV